MTEAHVKEVKTRLIDQAAKDKVKRKLNFDNIVCENNIKKKRDNNLQCTEYMSRSSTVRFFLGYKKPEEKLYMCVSCFESKHNIDTNKNPDYITACVRDYKVYSRPTNEEYCNTCSARLYTTVYEWQKATFD